MLKATKKDITKNRLFFMYKSPPKGILEFFGTDQRVLYTTFILMRTSFLRVSSRLSFYQTNANRE